MNITEYEACRHVVNALSSRGVLDQVVASSWSTPAGIEHAWKIKTPRLEHAITLAHPFDEESLLVVESKAYARQQHSAAIETSFMVAKDQLLRDLAVIHRHRLMGKDLPVPAEITIKEVVVQLSSQ